MALAPVWSSIRTVPETHCIIKRDFLAAFNLTNGNEKDLTLKACVWIAAMIDVVDAAGELNAHGGKYQIRRDLYACIPQSFRQFSFFLQGGNVTADHY